ncbi:hypothetical protein BC939DRAFT_146007 [Gamsiella multidivaricata]|uniref:uncharacterized protein n=1 Tax=Gamsiella multidivaricata TaxID=101098 RepID=UPI00221F029D|nr:uncharacterized protein BC939DRAFT_146007 [Gamsiella multidivaricata]KAI7831654.1 hypothetical protein BC939DRAFT_146007 [Gamsiella multidivaricata]
MPTYNILLLGQTQAGKSTFVQAVRKYADPNCKIDYQTIGNGNSSHTSEVQAYSIETQFPEYQLYDTSPHHPLSVMQYIQDSPMERELNIVDILGSPTLKEHRKKIGRVDDYELRLDCSSLRPTSVIHIFDTPGLNDTNGRDERNVAKTLSALSRSGAVHLVLILISRRVPLTPDLQDTLRTYSNIFSAMNGLIAFVHTNVDFKTQHPEDKDLMGYIDDRRADLARIMGRKIPHFLIDCDLEEERLACVYLRHRIIRYLLLLARFNVPVSLQNMQLCKTEKMNRVDELIAKENREKLAQIKKSCSEVDKAIRDIDFKANEIRYEIRELEEFIRNHDKEDVELIHEVHFEQNWVLFGSRHESELRSPDFEFSIDSISVYQFGIDVKEIRGGEGCKFWSVRLTRQSFHYGTYHAKLYTKRCNRHMQEIQERKGKLDSHRIDLERLLQDRNFLDNEDAGQCDIQAQRQQLAAESSRCLDMIARASRPTLHLNLFKAIAEAGVYEGTPAECVEKVSNFYSSYIPTAGEETPLMAHGL